MKHSELPWKLGEIKRHVKSSSGDIADTWPNIGGEISDNEAEANAQFIVKACNNFYPLLEALQELVALEGAVPDLDRHIFAMQKARQAIKEAE